MTTRRAQPLAAAVGIVADRILGEPALNPHPVAVLGRGLQAVETRLYADSRRAGIAHAVVGLGIGWSEDEYDAVGVPFSRRGRRGDEFLRCLKAIWTNDVVQFEGEFYRVPLARVAPKPIQKPHPPITYGGYGQAAVNRAVALADGFNGGNVPLGQMAPLLARLAAAAERAGRDPASLEIVSRGTYRVFDSPQRADRRPLWGSLDEIRDDIQRYAEAGLTELFLEANFAPGGAGFEPDPEVALNQTLEVMAALAPTR